MSRSRKKNPAGGMTTTASDKISKTMAHRLTRRAADSALRRGEEDLPSTKLTENPWRYEKDGKNWYGDCDPRLLRK